MERISNLFASYETSQWVQSRLVKILYLCDWICLLESGLFDLLFVSTAEIALPQIKFRAAKARITICNLFVVRTCTCKNVLYMYRTFSVAVSVAVMFLKKGSDSFVSYETSQ